jgi:hypothetical protein
MTKLVEYIQDREDISWRLNYEEGFAEPFPAYFDDLASNPDAIKYNGKIDKYLEDLGANDIKFIVGQNRWVFKLPIK